MAEARSSVYEHFPQLGRLRDEVRGQVEVEFVGPHRAVIGRSPPRFVQRWQRSRCRGASSGADQRADR